MTEPKPADAKTFEELTPMDLDGRSALWLLDKYVLWQRAEAARLEAKRACADASYQAHRARLAAISRRGTMVNWAVGIGIAAAAFAFLPTIRMHAAAIRGQAPEHIDGKLDVCTDRELIERAIVDLEECRSCLTEEKDDALQAGYDVARDVR